MLQREYNSGSTLTTVIIITTIIGIVLTIFLRHTISTLPSFGHRKSTLQAIANSRSSILFELEELKQVGVFDTSTITALFHDEEESSSSLWSSDLFGGESTTTESTPFSHQIISVGTMEDESYKTVAEVSSHYTPRDTVVILCSPIHLDAVNISGTTAQFDSDTVAGSLGANLNGVARTKEWVSNLFSDLTLELSAVQTISSQSGFNSLADTIKGDLFFDASWSGLELAGDGRTLTIYGDLQLTGAVDLQNVTLHVLGEVRINDKSRLSDCSVVNHNNVFFADESSFSGRLVSLDRIEIFHSAKVTEQSLILSFAGKESGKNSSDAKPELSDVGAINIRDQAEVSGAFITLGSEGIMTEMDTKSTGIQWAKTWIRHRGFHEGVLRAVQFVGEPTENELGGGATVGSDQATPSPATEEADPAEHVILGKVRTPFEKHTYSLPWFIGNQEITLWSESNL